MRGEGREKTRPEQAQEVVKLGELLSGCTELRRCGDDIIYIYIKFCDWRKQMRNYNYLQKMNVSEITESELIEICTKTYCRQACVLSK